jgi:hypothetical protein
MPTKSLASPVDELRSEYDLASLSGRVRGKYYARATAGTTLVLLEPDVAKAFPNGSSVNAALRAYLGAEQNGRRKAAIKQSQPPTARVQSKKRAARRRG